MSLKRYLAFTLLEVLVTIAVIGGVAAGAYLVITNVTATSNTAKLEQDIALVNRALQVYQTHGGKIPSGLTADQVLAKLRREAANPRLAGIKGTLVDPRLTIRWQGASEAANGGKRAYWDDTTKKFVIADRGTSPGVKEFYAGSLPEPLPMGADENGNPVDPNFDKRDGNIQEFAAVDKWVWDYDRKGGVNRTGKYDVAVGMVDQSLNEASTSSDAVPLDPPLFSVDGGTYPLLRYPMSLTLSRMPSTPPDISEIYYYTNGGGWKPYSGPLTLDPGATVIAKTVSLDPDHYLGSGERAEDYATTKVQLALSTTLKTSYRYAELGGPLAPGSPAPVLAAVPKINLANAAEVPDNWETSESFQTYWTWDGSDPSVAGSARVAGLGFFTNPYPGEELGLTLNTFGTSTSKTLRYIALSKKPEGVTSSSIGTATVTALKTSLLPPIVTPGNGALSNGDAIYINVNVTGGQTPAGTRIYYRTDGVDPGDNNGEPAVTAKLYTGEFQLAPDTSPFVQLVARVYPPTAYKTWFTTSQSTTMTYYLPYANANVYAVEGGDPKLYLVNPSSGENSLIDDRSAYNLRSIALDGNKSRLYYVEETSGSAGWRLGYLDFITRTHVQMGNLKGSWSYNASVQPQNLAFFNGALYYIHSNTDDLIRINFNADSTAIASIEKVADIRNNTASFTYVGDMAIEDSGLMFFCDSSKKYWRFNLVNMSGIVQLGTCARTFEGMAFFQARLFATDVGTTKVWRLVPNAGKDLSSVSASPARDFVDLAAPSAAVPVLPSNSLWAIAEQSDGPHLVEFRNYRSPLISSAVDYGAMLYDDLQGPSTLLSFSNASGSGVQSLAITSDGQAYFVRNRTVSINKLNYARPLFKLNLANLRLGDVPQAVFVGDLGAGLTAMAGTLDPDDAVSGLTLSPGGQLYGVLREGLATADTNADYLFRCTQTVSALSGTQLAITSCGRLTSAVASSNTTEDLVFSRDGSLYVSDTATSSVLHVNPDNGSVLSIVSNEPGSQYLGLAVDNADYRMIAANSGGTNPNTFLKVDGGTGNDDEYLNYQTRWGYSSLPAISFYQAPFLPLTSGMHLYAADGTPTIYGVDFSTGQTVPVTDAPFGVRALAYDLLRRRVFYLENSPTQFRIGSFDVDTHVHLIHGSLQQLGLAYYPQNLPDNLAYYSGYLWYVEPKTDNLIKVEIGASGIVLQEKASNITGNAMAFDLIGDLAIDPDGWMYFSSTRTDGQRFSRFRIKTMSNLETISGPIPPPVLVADGGTYRENWFDALAFGPPEAGGVRKLYGTYSSAPAPMHLVDSTSGNSAPYKMTTPAVNIIDFSDQHPGDLSNPTGVTLKPQLLFTNLYPSYTYAQVGGPLLAGSSAPPALAPDPLITLANANEFTTTQLSSSYFKILWTYDGSNPRISVTAQTGANFSNGFPGQPVSVSFNQWQNSSSLTLTALAKSQQTSVMLDSLPVTATLQAARTTLRSPIVMEGPDVAGVRQIQILPDINNGDCPPGTRIYYTTDGTDPGVQSDASGLQNPISGTLYTGTIPVPTTGTSFLVTARVYPPVDLPQWFGASPADYLDMPLGLAGGHMDVDTSSAVYPFRSGKTDAHVHEYDKRYNVIGANFFDMLDHKLHNIQDNVPAGTKFKIIIANGSLSTAGRLVINKTYNPSDSSTWIPVATYDDTLPQNLPIYSIDGIAGTTKLDKCGLYFDTNAIVNGGLLPTVTGHVKQNNPGLYGEWRNGALTIQAVKVNADGSAAFTTNPSYSGGGVQGPAQSGLLWELTVFWHHTGGPYGGAPGQSGYAADGTYIGP